MIKDLKSRGMLDDTLVHLDHRVRADALLAEGSRSRPQPLRLHELARRRRHQRGRQLRAERRVGLQARRPEVADQGYDIHATILHLLGIDHTRLTVRHDGIDRRLTDVHGRVIDEIIA